jgi:Lipid A 3-O-deacylase (PagL)
MTSVVGSAGATYTRALTLALVVFFGWCGAPAAAQESSDETVPFHTKWLVLGGAGTDVRPTSDRDVAFQSIQWGCNVTGERGPGVLKGQLEMAIEFTPVFAAFQSHTAEGMGFSPIVFRWNFRQRGTIAPFVEAAAGMMATNRDVPENTWRVNFSEHAGGGARIRIARQWAVMIGYRLHHLSNAGTMSRHPGVTSHVGYAGVAWMVGRHERNAIGSSEATF